MGGRYRKRSNAMRREKYVRQETITASVLVTGAWASNLEGSRAVEVLELRRRVAGERIRKWFRSPEFQRGRVRRRFAVTIVQAMWRGRMANRRLVRIRKMQEEKDAALNRWMNTCVGAMSPERAVEIVIARYREYKLFCAAKVLQP